VRLAADRDPAGAAGQHHDARGDSVDDVDDGRHDDGRHDEHGQPREARRQEKEEVRGLVLDIRLIRRDPDAVRTALERRGPEVAAQVDRVLELDERWRALTAELEELRAEQNRKSRGRQGAPTPEEREELAALAARGRALSDEETAVRGQREAVLASLPNLPADDAPDEDTVLREVGEAGATGKDHLELAGRRIDMERGSRLSGSRFAYLRGELVLLELALVRYAFEKLGGEGFEPVIPPVIVREHALYGTGFLPDTERQIYRLADDELYLVGTSEVALASLHQDEILAGDELPLRYAGFSTCFRREAGAAGKDTRGIFRVHQFDKVEMFSFVAPEESGAEHERLLAIEESILQELEIPYRVVAIAIGDLGASAAKKYDCEAWLPGQGRYRELTSCSNTTDYQARRLDIRYRAADGKPAHVQTLNGTAVAVGRTIIALLENGQRDDGSVVLPAPLVRFGAPDVLAPAD
jgi:seryl-tRNA synthetase